VVVQRFSWDGFGREVVVTDSVVAMRSGQEDDCPAQRVMVVSFAGCDGDDDGTDGRTNDA